MKNFFEKTNKSFENNNEAQAEVKKQQGWIENIITKAKQLAAGKEQVFEDVKGVIKILAVLLLLRPGAVDAQESKTNIENAKNIFSIENMFQKPISELKENLSLVFTSNDISDTSFVWETTFQKEGEQEVVKRNTKGLLPQKSEKLENVVICTKTDLVQREIQNNENNMSTTNLEESLSSSLLISQKDNGYFKKTGKTLRVAKTGRTRQEAIVDALKELANQISIEVFSAEAIQNAEAVQNTSGDHTLNSTINKNFSSVIGTRSSHGFSEVRVVDITEKHLGDEISYEVELEGDVGIHQSE